MDKENNIVCGNVIKFASQANYLQWRFQIKCALRAKGLSKYIEDVNPIRVGSSGDTGLSTEAAEKIDKEDASAMFVITSSLTLEQIVLIQNCETAREIIKKLDSIYAKKTEFTKMALHEKFYQYKMSDKDSVAEHVSKVESIAKQIRESGEVISDTAIITKIIGSLPSKYKGFRQAWLSTEEQKQTIDNLTVRLIDEEANLNHSDAMEPEALATTSRDSRQTITCFYCKKKGHIAKNCYVLQRNQSKNKVKYNSNFSAFNDNYFIDINTLCMDECDVWLLDSGASAHMTYRRDFFHDFYECQPNTVRLGDNTELSVKGVGTIRIKKFINGSWYNSNITDVRFIPSLQRNLISEGVLAEKGFKIVKYKKEANIFNEHGLLAACAYRQPNNLYKLLFKTEMSLVANAVTDDNLKLWHDRLGHINTTYLKELKTKELAHGVTLSQFDDHDFFCEACAYGKQHKLPFESNASERKACSPGEVIYSDVCGPMTANSVAGYKYFILFKDACTGFRVVAFLKNKSDTFESFKEFLRLCTNKFGKPIKVLHCDNGREYCNNEFKNFLNNFGIILETTAPYTPEQNGRAERDMRTIMESARSMLHNANVPLYLWAEAVNCAVYLLNRTTTRQTPNSTPFEMWNGEKPNLGHVKVFGCDAYMHIPSQLRTKLQEKSKKLTFVGYDGNSSNYRLFDSQTQKIKISRNVLFNENSFTNLQEKIENRNKLLIDMNDSQKSDNLTNTEDKTIDKDTANKHNTNDNLECRELNEHDTFYDTEDIVLNNTPINQVKQLEHDLRPRDKLKAPDRYEAHLIDITEPSSFDDAMKSPDAERWKEAIDSELKSLLTNETWELTNLPPGKIPISSKWVFKIKCNPDGSISRYKARLVAKGFNQVEGIDYNETFSPTTRYDSIRILLALSVKHGFYMKQFDVKTAFLHGQLDEEIYMRIPEGLEQNNNKVCKLKRSLYGLKQAPRCWNKRLDSVLKEMGFRNIQADKCIYVGEIKGINIILAVYVDDGLLLSKDQSVLNIFLERFKKDFEITVIDSPKCFIGLELIQENQNTKIFISQRNYIKNMLKRFNLNEAKPVIVPSFIDLPESNEDIHNKEVPYREALGCLIYLATTTRPDISYAVGVLSRHLTNFTLEDWHNAKRIMRYLSGTIDFGIEYNKVNDDDEYITGYSDSDYATDTESRRSTTGYTFVMSGAPITWCSRRQSSVALSTTEAEYMAVCDAAKEAMWIKQFIKDVEGVEIKPMKIYTDSQSALKLIKIQNITNVLNI